MTDVKEQVTITLPLYEWLLLLGAIANLADESSYARLADQVLGQVQP